MKRIITALTILALLLCALPASAEKRTDRPELFRAKVEFTDRKEEDNRYYISKEYLITANEIVNEILRKRTDNFDTAMRPLMKPCPSKNAKRNSRLDIETVYTFTGDSWISTMILARLTFERKQLDVPFITGVYDLRTGDEITMGDLFAKDSPAWQVLSEGVTDQLNAYYPQDPRNPEGVAELAEIPALRGASFTLSAMELTLHYPAQLVYPGQTGIMHVRFFYDDLWDMMTPEARVQTDNTDWKMVALTCDDGVSYTDTPAVLNSWRRGGARITYFIVGKTLLEYPELAKREADQNHILACHSHTHRNGHRLSEAQILREISNHQKLMEQIVGVPSSLFRAPGGTYPPWIKAKIGLPVIQWSVDTYDYTGKSADRICYSLRKHVKDGDVILMHDTSKELAKAAKEITEYLWDHGYMMVTVEELARANDVKMEPNTLYYRFIDGRTDKRTDSNLN